MTTEVKITNRDGIAEIKFKKNRKVISWEDLTKKEQTNLLVSMRCTISLCNKFLKNE